MYNFYITEEGIMKKIILAFGFILAISGVFVGSGLSAQEESLEKDPEQLYAVIETDKGTMEFLLYKNVAPITVTSFVNLATRGYFDGLSFHRVIDGFMAQGGDPTGTGSGGPGYEFQNEVAMRHNQKGILSMANAGADTNGSQFFITHLATPHLNGLHTVFGKVHSGSELILGIERGDVILSITIVGDARAFLERKSDQVREWNDILDFGFTELRPSLID